MHIFAARFTIGWMVITPRALVALVESQEDPRDFVNRHLKGDWGDVGPDGWAENEYAVRHGERLVSAYQTRHGRKLYVVTEANRYSTTVLVPGELNVPRKETTMHATTVLKVNHEASKLDALASVWGLSTAAFIEEYALDEVVPGICMNPDCTYTSEVEPDQTEGWCEECETRSVRSGIVLAGLI